MKSLTCLFILIAVLLYPFLGLTDEAEETDTEVFKEPAEHRIERLLPEVGGVAHLGYTFNSRSEFKETPAEDMALHIIDISTLFPFRLNENTIVTVGADYKFHHFRIQNLVGYFPQEGKTLHHISNPIEFLFFFGNNWALDVNFTQILATDFNDFDQDDYQFGGHVVGGYALSDNTSAFFGVGFGKDFWRYFPYPILGLVYRPQESFFDMDMMLPDYARFNFKVADLLTLFLSGEFEGMVWDVAGEGTIPDQFVKLYDSRAGGGVQFKITEGLLVDLWGGINPWRRFEIRNNAGAKITRKQKIGFFAKTQFVVTPALFGL